MIDAISIDGLLMEVFGILPPASHVPHYNTTHANEAGTLEQWEGSMGLIRAAHINDLADFTEGRDLLGEMVRRLIWNWLPNRISAVHFHSGETNNYPGWDGVVRMTFASGSSHSSLWELSVRKDAPQKIRDDFVASMSRPLPPGWVRANTTYVAVTARSLPNTSELELELLHSASNPWADVRIIDATALVHWIELCPAVEQWMSEAFSVAGIPSTTSLSRYWSRWSEVTQPPITPSLVSAGRDLSAITNGLHFETSRLLSVQADSPEEAVGVVFAAVHAMPECARDSLLTNATVIASKEAAQRVAESPRRDEAEPFTILVPPAAELAQALVKRGHRVAVAFGRSSPNSSAVSLRRALRSDFEQALVDTMGVPRSDASAQAHACGGSVSIWRVWRLLSHGSLGEFPAWARNRAVVPAVLARAWDEKFSADKDVLALLAASDYDAFNDGIHEYLTCNDPLHERSHTIQKVIAPSVAYALVRDAVTGTQVRNLSEAMHRVFSTVDSDVIDVWESMEVTTPHSRKATYSGWLKEGLAETLLAIAFLPQPNTGVFHPFGGGRGFAENLVHGLPGLRTDPRLLASLRDQLPMLAEAAPGPFVSALEELVQGYDLEPLFRDRGLFSTSFHVGLLWSLEVLAWSSEHLAPVTRLLLALADRYDTGRHGDTPIDSLREIYLAWMRNTTVPGDQRAALLKDLFPEFPSTVWRLLLSLLPQDHDTSSGTRRPIWRDFGRSELVELKQREVSRTYRLYAQLALQQARTSLERQIDLLEFYAAFPDEYRQQLIAMLETNPGSANVVAWKRLQDFLAKNRSFADTEWAVDADSLARLDSIVATLAPTVPSIRNRWLFEDDWPEIGTPTAEWAERETRLAKLRRDAVAAILAEEGVDAIATLVCNVKHSYVLGATLAALPESTEWLLERLSEWVACGKGEGELPAIRAASGVRHRLEGVAWADMLLATARAQNWPASAIGEGLLGLQPKMTTFTRVAEHNTEVQRYYWVNCWLHPQDLDALEKQYASAQLLAHGRAAYLLDLVAQAPSEFGVDIASEAMDRTIRALLTSGTPAGQLHAHHIDRVLKWLRKEPRANRVAIAQMEYALIPILTVRPHSHHQDTLVLHELLGQDPEFFIQILSDAYRARSDAEQNPDRPLDDDVRARARVGFRLLRSWKQVPGALGDGTIDRDLLRTWIVSVKELASQRDRLDVALLKIGEVLYHGQPDPATATWPQTAILELFEEMASEPMERGFCLECINDRGATSRGIFDGGAQERELQRTWEARAAALDLRWTRTRAMFLRIAQDWGQQALWHDQDAEQTRMRWS